MAEINDFGIKVALPGFDVKTATPEQCSMHSNYPHMKIQRPTSGVSFFNTFQYTFSSNPGNGTVTNLLTINHNYGYKPANMAFVYANTGAGSQIPINSYLNLPAVFGTGALNQYFRCWADAVSFKVEYCVVSAPPALFDVTNTVWTFKYYVFAENGA